MSRFRPYFKHYKPLMVLGIPIMVGQLGMIVLGFADTIMIGRYSTEALGASGFVNNLFNLVIIGSTGFAYGLTPLVSSNHGQGRHQAIGRLLKNALWVNFSVAVVFTVIMGIVYRNIGRFGQPEELMPLIKPYYLVLLASLVPVLLFNAFRQFADGITDTKTSMWILAFGNALNILCNWLLIYGEWGFPEMGLLGAGVATLFSRIAMLVVFIAVFLMRTRYRVHLRGFFRSPVNGRDFLMLNRLGWPLALQMTMETSAFCLSAVMVGWLGTEALAAHQVMLTISTVFFMLYYGMGAATSVRVSYFLGRLDITEARRTASSGFHLTLVMALILNAAFWQVRFLIGGLFTDNAAVLWMISGLFLPMVVYQFGDCLQITFANALRGIMDVKFLMFSSFIAYFVISLPLSYLFGFTFGFGLVGIWMAFPFGLTSAGLMFLFRFLSRTRMMESRLSAQGCRADIL